MLNLVIAKDAKSRWGAHKITDRLKIIPDSKTLTYWVSEQCKLKERRLDSQDFFS